MLVKKLKGIHINKKHGLYKTAKSVKTGKIKFMEMRKHKTFLDLFKYLMR